MAEDNLTDLPAGQRPRLRRGYSSVVDGVTFAKPPEPGSIPQLGYRAVFILIVLFLYLYSVAVNGLLSMQFIFYKLSGYSANGSNAENHTSCLANISETSLDNDIQKDASQIQMYLTLFTSIPSMFTCIILGALSDRAGRRICFGLPILGLLGRSVVYAIVDFTDASMYYLIIGNAMDGFSGGFACFLLGAFAGSADTTAGGRRRSLRIALVEAFGTISVGLGSLSLGFMIDSSGYTLPNAVVAGICVINLILVMFAIPETHSTVPREKLTLKVFKASVSRVFGFYFVKGEGFQRVRFILCWVAFFLTSVCLVGSVGVETLFQKRYPLCWDSLKIGYFGSIKSVATAVAVVAVIKILQLCLGDIGIGIFCAVGKIASLILESFSTTDLEMYLVAIVGMAGIGALAMLRSIMSKATPREDLGAMFASVAFAETTTTLVGGVFFNAIYNVSVADMPGLVFLVMAGLTTIVFIIFLILYCVIRIEKRRKDDAGERQSLLGHGKVDFY